MKACWELDSLESEKVFMVTAYGFIVSDSSDEMLLRTFTNFTKKLGLQVLASTTAYVKKVV